MTGGKKATSQPAESKTPSSHITWPKAVRTALSRLKQAYAGFDASSSSRSAATVVAVVSRCSMAWPIDSRIEAKYLMVICTYSFFFFQDISDENGMNCTLSPCAMV